MQHACVRGKGSPLSWQINHILEDSFKTHKGLCKTALIRLDIFITMKLWDQ